MLRFFSSLFRSVVDGLRQNPYVQRWADRNPRLARFLHSRVSRNNRFGLHLTIGILLALYFAWQFVTVLEGFLKQELLFQSDVRVLALVSMFRGPVADQVMRTATALADPVVILFGSALLVAWLGARQRIWDMGALAFSVIGGEAFVWFMKHIVARPRPPIRNALLIENDFSFPSGHAFIAIAFYGLLAYILFRGLRRPLCRLLLVIVAVVLVLLIGLSRVYLGVHWPSDVLAGWTAGAAWLAFLISARELGPTSLPEPHRWRIGITLGVVWLVLVVPYVRFHPLVVPPKVEEVSQVVSSSKIIEEVFAKYPRTSEDVAGRAMEPINIVLVASEERLDRVLSDAGWYISDPLSWQSMFRSARTALFRQPYPQIPGVPSFWNTRVNDFSFTRPTERNLSRERHHLHIWRTRFETVDGKRVWLGTAHYDKAIKWKTSILIPTHEIDPAVDNERDEIKKDLAQTGEVLSTTTVQMVEPQLGNNQVGSLFFTDGKAYIFEL